MSATTEIWPPSDGPFSAWAPAFTSAGLSVLQLLLLLLLLLGKHGVLRAA